MLIISFVIICTLENECTDWQCKFETSSILRWKSQNHYIFTYLYSVWRSMSDLYLVLRTKYTVYAVTEQIYSLTSVEPNNNIPKKWKVAECNTDFCMILQKKNPKQIALSLVWSWDLKADTVVLIQNEGDQTTSNASGQSNLAYQRPNSVLFVTCIDKGYSLILGF